MRRTVTTILLAVLCTAVFAQRRVIEPEKLDWLNPWTGLPNRAGLSEDAAFLSDSLKVAGDINGSLQFSGGALRNVFTPEDDLNAGIFTESHLKAGRVFLYGNFGYNYEYGRGSAWRGFSDPYESPFMLCDSIPGNTSNEVYSMEAAVAVPLGRWSLGLDATYRAALFAKHKDLRNKNTRMDFSITPSVTFTAGPVTLGLDGGYARRTERVEYIQVDQTTEKYLFDLFGLWMYYSSGFSTAENKRDKIGYAGYGDFQLSLSFGSFRILNSFGARYSFESQGETGYNNLRHGDTKSLTYSDGLSIYIGGKHRIRASLSLTDMLGYRFLQRQELDASSGVRVWVTYGSAMNTYSERTGEFSLDYTFRKPSADGHGSDWEISAGVKGRDLRRICKEYPLLFSQSVSSVTPFVGFSKDIGLGKGMSLRVNPFAEYMAVWKGSPCTIENLSGGEVTEGDVPWRLAAPDAREYGWLSTDRISAGLDLRFALPVKAAGALYVKAQYHIDAGVRGGLKGLVRHNAGAGVGFLF